MNVSKEECSVITVRVVVIMAQIQPDILGNADLSLLPPHAPHPSILDWRGSALTQPSS